MARYTVTLSGDTSGTYVCDVHRPRAFYQWFGILGAQGSSFGSGTLTWYLSIDGGSTLIALKDITDTAISQISNGMVSVPLVSGGDKLSETLRIYVKLAGSTNPNITVFVLDNN